jgi:hypothetical protein
VSELALLLVAIASLATGVRCFRLYRAWAKKREEGWRLVGWRRLPYRAYEFRFKNGTVVRDGYYYPSGQFLGPLDSQWYRLKALEKQIEFGQHAELETK